MAIQVLPSRTNLAQVSGTAIVLGSAASAASLPVVIASDQAAVTVKQATAANLNATVTGSVGVTGALPAGANVIGHVIADSGSTTAVTGNVTVVQPTGTNLHAVLDAGTAVIGHVIADSGSTTAVTGNVTVIGAGTPADSFANPTTALVAQTHGMVWSSADSDWDRAVSASGDALASTLGIPAAGNVLWNGTTWDRQKESTGTNSAYAATGIPAFQALLYGSAGNAFAMGSGQLGDGGNAAQAAAAAQYNYNGTSWDRQRGLAGSKEQSVTNGGLLTAAIAVNNILTAVKASAGRLARIVITTAGTTGLSIFDNASAASGTVLFTFPATTVVGTVYDIQMPAANGITVAAGATTSPGFTLSYS